MADAGARHAAARQRRSLHHAIRVAVADILAGYRLDTASIATGLLHDVIEDTPVKLPEIERRFGQEIAGLVDGVTKLTRLELQSDRTKQAENFRKLVLAMSRDIRVLLVKLADRLHNMRTLHFVRDPDRRQRIARETMEIYAPLAERIGMDAVKTELQTLAFTQLDPEAYATIQARLNFLRGQGADVIEEVRRELRRVCEDAGVEVVEVTGPREVALLDLGEDAPPERGVRAAVRHHGVPGCGADARGDCYAALGAVHSAYPVIAGRFKDYISTPKSNGYQSLHTGVTLREPRNQKIEIQIRTARDGATSPRTASPRTGCTRRPTRSADGKDVQRFRWVQDLLEILENSAAPDEFLENTKLELYDDQVFCFTPKGQLIQLPRGATPVDFAYAVHSQVGDTCVGAKVNGRLMPLRHQLQNGDQVEIMTARGGTPSPQWERFVVTGKARARIRRFIHQQQREQHRDCGQGGTRPRRSVRPGVDGSEKVLEPALKALKLAGIDDLYIAVGNGNIGAAGRGARGLSGAAAGAARAAHDAVAAAARPGGADAAGQRHADHRPGAGHGVSLRRLLPSGAGRRDRRHRHHRQGRDDPCAATARRWRASPRRRSASSTSTGTMKCWQGRAGRQGHPGIPRGSA